MKNVSVIQLARHHLRVTQSQASVCAGQELRGDCARLAAQDILVSPHVAAELVTVIQWAPCPCSVTVMAPVTVDQALWATNATNVK